MNGEGLKSDHADLVACAHSIPMHSLSEYIICTKCRNADEPIYTEKDLVEITKNKNPIPTPDDLRESLATFISQVVVLLHTVKEEEMIATLKYLSPPVEQSDKPIRWFHGNISFILGIFGDHKAALVQTSKGADCLPELMPSLRSLPNAKLIITLGYAYGLKSQCNLGDVLVSTSIDGIGNIRLEHGRLKFDEGRVRQTSMSTRALNVFTKGTILWTKFICSKGRETKVVAGPLISSPALVNDKVALDEYLKNNERFKGGEMEGQEVARAQLTLKEEDKRDVDFIVIKGVADFGDGSKAKGWQLTASLAAASYAEEKLRESGGNVYNCKLFQG